MVYHVLIPWCNNGLILKYRTDNLHMYNNQKGGEGETVVERICGPAPIIVVTCVKSIKYEPPYEKTGFLHMRKQIRRSAAQ